MADIEKRIGQKCWIDLNGIESSDEFVEKTIRAINKAEVIIFMHSKRSAKALMSEKRFMEGSPAAGCYATPADVAARTEFPS